MADWFDFLIRYVHILSAVLWIGGAALWTMLIAPNVLQRGPPPIRRPFLEAVLARFTRYMILAGGLTIVSGFWVFGLLAGWSDYFAEFRGGGDYPLAWGLSLGIGAVLAIVSYAEGWFVIRPTAHKLLETMQRIPAPAPGAPPAPPPPEVQAELAALGKKVGIAGLTSLVLGFLALAAMVYAVNYVR